MNTGIHRVAIIALATCTACVGPTPGPDKQFSTMAKGAAVGAGTGAVTGFQIGSGAGPGAAVGAGFGAVAGGIRGALADQAEENLLRLANETELERRRAIAHEIIAEQYKRRLELHPTREIYPADLFFYGDESELRPESIILVKEIARLNKDRLPWSRLAVVAYAISRDEDPQYAERLTARRSRAISDYMVRAGIEPRRLEARAVVVEEPLLIDPYDRAERYSQAIEIIPLDR